MALFPRPLAPSPPASVPPQPPPATAVVAAPPEPAASAASATAAASSSPGRPHRDYPGILCNSCRLSSGELGRRGGSASPLLLARCSGCRAVYYCSKRCQKADWAQHKQLCRQVRLMHERQQGMAKLYSHSHSHSHGHNHSHRHADTGTAGHADASSSSGMWTAVAQPLPRHQSPSQLVPSGAAPSGRSAYPAVGDEVFVHYVAKLANGVVFDKSFAPPPTPPLAAASQPPPVATPYSFTYRAIPPPPHSLHSQPTTQPALIAGLSIALLSFAWGESAALLVTAPYAWGEAGISGLVPPKSTVLIELHCCGWLSAADRLERAQSGWQRCMADRSWRSDHMDAAIEAITQRSSEQQSADSDPHRKAGYDRSAFAGTAEFGRSYT